MSFRCFCGFVRDEETPERTAFVRFRRLLVEHGLDQSLFATITLDKKGAPIRIGTIIDANIIGSASKADGEAVAAIVVPAPGAALDESSVKKSSGKKKLAKFKLPRREILVEELPRNAMGKVQKNLLRERFGDLFVS